MSSPLFDADAFMQRMIKLTHDMQVEAEQWNQRLAVSAIIEDSRYLALTVNPGGGVADVTFTEDVAELSNARLAKELMDCYRTAAVKVNRALASQMPGELSDLVRQSIPESMQDTADKVDEQLENEGAATSKPLEKPADNEDRVWTMDDIKLDSTTQEWLDSWGTPEDPFAGLDEAFKNRPFPHSNWENERESFEDNIRAKLQRISDAGRQLKGKLKNLTAEVEGKLVTVEVDPGGCLVSVSFRSNVNKYEASEIREEFLKTYQQAVQQAHQSMVEEFADSGISDDPEADLKTLGLGV